MSHKTVNAKSDVFPFEIHSVVDVLARHRSLAYCTIMAHLDQLSRAAGVKLALLVGMATMASGCAADASTYPSLARRAIEQHYDVVASLPATPPVPAPVSATLSAAIRGLGGDADRADAAFRALLAASANVISSAIGASDGSEAWAEANIALSRLEAARGPAVLALAEIDRLAIEQALANDAGAVAALSVEQDRLAALITDQSQALAQLTR